jgi:Peptidase of plants and bacteria
MKSQTNGQAIGSIVHEAVHVVQQYGRGRRNNPDATRNPGWLVEGIADYIRFYKFEPQTHGAEISRRGFDGARYDGSYRVTANFLNWVVETHDKDLIRKLNAAMREGKYNEEIWSQNTGKTVDELNDEWKAQLKAKFDSRDGKAGDSKASKPL